MKEKITRHDRVFYTGNAIFLGVILLLTLYPIIYVLSSSFSSPAAVIAGKVWLFPVDFSLEGYTAVFKNDFIITGYANTIFYTVFGTIISIVMTILIAYPLSRKEYLPRNIVMLAFVFTMLFTGGLIPNYMLMQQLNILNTRWAMLLPRAIGVYNVIIARTFFMETIPNELWEASSVDGCSHIRYLWSIVLPLSKAIIAVMTLFYAVANWNMFFDAFIYLSDDKLYPLQIVLREILIMNEIDAGMIEDPELMAARQGLADLLRYSLVIVASVPVLCIYPFAQKYFVKGVMIGSVKG